MYTVRAYRITIEQSIELIFLYNTGTRIPNLCTRYNISVSCTLKHIKHKDFIENTAIKSQAQVNIPLDRLSSVFPRLAAHLSRRRKLAASSYNRVNFNQNVSFVTSCETVSSTYIENISNIITSITHYQRTYHQIQESPINSNPGPSQSSTKTLVCTNFQPVLRPMLLGPPSASNQVSYHFRSTTIHRSRPSTNDNRRLTVLPNKTPKRPRTKASSPNRDCFVCVGRSFATRSLCFIN